MMRGVEYTNVPAAIVPGIPELEKNPREQDRNDARMKREMGREHGHRSDKRLEASRFAADGAFYFRIIYKDFRFTLACTAIGCP